MRLCCNSCSHKFSEAIFCIIVFLNNVLKLSFVSWLLRNIFWSRFMLYGLRSNALNHFSVSWHSGTIFWSYLMFGMVMVFGNHFAKICTFSRELFSPLEQRFFFWTYFSLESLGNILNLDTKYFCLLIIMNEFGFKIALFPRLQFDAPQPRESGGLTPLQGEKPVGVFVEPTFESRKTPTGFPGYSQKAIWGAWLIVGQRMHFT